MTELLPLPVKLLAVAGGATFGWLAIGFLASLLRRALGVGSVPRLPLLVARALGAAVAGVAIWLWVFGHGGAGIGGPGGTSVGGAPGSGKGTSQDKPRPTPLASPNRANTLSIVMLGGDAVQEDRFYQILGEKKALTLKELKELIRQRQAKGIEITITGDSVAKETPPVTGLQEWARQNDLTVSLVLPEKRAP